MNLDLKLVRGDVKKIVPRLWKHQATFALQLKNIFIWPNFSVHFSLIIYLFYFILSFFSKHPSIYLFYHLFYLNDNISIIFYYYLILFYCPYLCSYAVYVKTLHFI